MSYLYCHYTLYCTFAVQVIFVVLCLFQLAKKYNMVIVSPIFERDETHGDTLHNTAGKLRHLIDLV